MGKNLNGDIEVLQSIRATHPDCLFILDANEGYTATEAINVLEKLHGKVFSLLQVIIYGQRNDKEFLNLSSRYLPSYTRHISMINV